jgi:hypothetical protein
MAVVYRFVVSRYKASIDLPKTSWTIWYLVAVLWDFFSHQPWPQLHHVICILANRICFPTWSSICHSSRRVFRPIGYEALLNNYLNRLVYLTSIWIVLSYITYPRDESRALHSGDIEWLQRKLSWLTACGTCYWGRWFVWVFLSSNQHGLATLWSQLVIMAETPAGAPRERRIFVSGERLRSLFICEPGRLCSVKQHSPFAITEAISSVSVMDEDDWSQHGWQITV